MTQTQANCIFFFIWVFMGIAVCFPIYLGYSSFLGGLQPGKLVCAVAWWDDHLESKICNALVVGVVMCVMVVINIIYSEIFKTFSKAQRDRDALLDGASQIEESNSANDGKTDATAAAKKLKKGGGFLAPLMSLSVKERQLLTKCVLITGSFMICWLPMLAKILYEMITKTPSSSSYDLFCTVFAASNTIINGLLLIFLDSRIKTQVVESLPDWVRFKLENWSKRTESRGNTTSTESPEPAPHHLPQSSENNDI